MTDLQVTTPPQSAKQQTVTFPHGDKKQFISEMKQRVHGYFEESGISQKANVRMIVKTFLMLAMVAVPYFLIMTNRMPPLAMLGLCVVMGVGVAGC